MDTNKLSLLLIALAVMMLPSIAHSQTTDSVRVHRGNLLKVMAAADSFKVAKVELRLLKEDLSNTQAAIVQLKVAVAKAETADSLSQKNLVLALQREDLLKGQIKLAEAAAANWEKAYKREKRKRIVTGAIGMATTVAAFIINLKK